MRTHPPRPSYPRWAAALLLLPLLLSPRGAFAHEGEIGGFIGGHFFSPSTELGRLDLDPRDNAPMHSFALGLRGAYGPIPRLHLEAELAFLPTQTRNGQATILGLAYRAHVLVHLLTGRVRPFLLAGVGAVSSAYSSNEGLLSRDTDEAFHVGAGVKIDVTRRFGLRLDGRVLVVPRIEDASVTADGEVFLGAYYRLGVRRTARPTPLDSDGDGIKNEQDKCPDEPEDEDGFQDDDGCPDPDNDGDGVLDKDDRCPDKAGPADNKGCPKKNQPAPAPPPNPDRDGDGIVNAEDRCPDQAGERATSGCPDRDADGIADGDDRCPDAAETRNGFEDLDGCPDELPKAVARFTGAIRGINFASGKDVILRPSFKVLNDAAKVLLEFPDLRLEISGHTDNVGKREANTDLSRRRAEAVRRYLMTRGIGGGRLEAVGYGPERPLADNKTKAGKTKNRRVEFKLLSP